MNELAEEGVFFRLHGFGIVISLLNIIRTRTVTQFVRTALFYQSVVKSDNIQDELEVIWTRLQMPDSLKLDMAVKYSSDKFHALLHQVSAPETFACERLEGFRGLQILKHLYNEVTQTIFLKGKAIYV